MKKIITAFTCIVFATGSLLHADDAAPAATEQQQQEVPPQSEPKQVGKAPEDDSSSSNVWKNWAIAAGVVIIAVVALIFVSKNEGSKH